MVPRKWPVVAMVVLCSCSTGTSSLPGSPLQGDDRGRADAGLTGATDGGATPSDAGASDAGTVGEDAGVRDAGVAQWTTVGTIEGRRSNYLYYLGPAFVAVGDDGGLAVAFSQGAANERGNNSIRAASWNLESDGGTWEFLGEGQVPEMQGPSFNEASGLFREADGRLKFGWRAAGSANDCIPRATTSNFYAWDGATWSPVGERLTGYPADPEPHHTQNLVLRRSHGGDYFAAFSEVPPEDGCQAPVPSDHAYVFVQRFSGSGWTALGGAQGMAPGYSELNDFTLDPDGNPTVLYTTTEDFYAGTPGDVLAARWDGTTWKILGGGPVCPTGCHASRMVSGAAGTVILTGPGAVKSYLLQNNQWKEIPFIDEVDSNIHDLKADSKGTVYTLTSSKIWVSTDGLTQSTSITLPESLLPRSFAVTDQGTLYVIGALVDREGTAAVVLERYGTEEKP